jgi:hypothetical protein
MQNQETTLTWDPLLFASIYLSTDDVIFFLSHPSVLDFSLYSPVNTPPAAYSGRRQAPLPLPLSGASPPSSSHPISFIEVQFPPSLVLLQLLSPGASTPRADLGRGAVAGGGSE